MLVTTRATLRPRLSSVSVAMITIDAGGPPDVSRAQPALATALPDGGRQLLEQGGGGVPAQAGVGDALAVGQRPVRLDVLPPLDEVALDHHPDDRGVAARDLSGDRPGHF